jgi:dTDP-4-dehydrorhamnose reductase
VKILITGSNGLLGQKLVAYCLANGIDFIATSKGQNRNSNCPEDCFKSLDVTNEREVFEIVLSHEPTHVIHTAAMTNVDACENDKEGCYELNVLATKFIVLACNEIEAHFQLLSTDFVFDGTKGNYREEDEVNPLSEYARSKAQAEQITRELSTSPYSIVRTIIVYGLGENLSRSNIVVWAKGALEKGDPLTIVDDQFRAPTFAEDLAVGCMAIVEKGHVGVYHISGPETLSIYDIVVRIGRHFGYETENIEKISSSALNQTAQRPPKTGFDLTKAYNNLEYKPHTLEESLSEMF